MALLLAFFFGMTNFAAQRAVLDSGHPMLRAIPARAFGVLRLASLSLEFALLLSAMLAVAGGHPDWLWLYGGYSLFNASIAFAVVTRRI